MAIFLFIVTFSISFPTLTAIRYGDWVNDPPQYGEIGHFVGLREALLSCLFPAVCVGIVSVAILFMLFGMYESKPDETIEDKDDSV